VGLEDNESGRNEVYVRPFSPPGAANPSNGGGKWQISKSGGTRPHWRGDNKELYYVGPDARLMAVDVTASAAFETGIPQPLVNITGNPDLQVTPDGKSFLIATRRIKPPPSFPLPCC
jgi:hypothetical protein